MKKIKVRQLYYHDLENNFVETLSALKPTNLSINDLRYLYIRRRSKIKTFIAINNTYGEKNIIVGTISLFLEQKFINNGGICGHIEDMAVHKDYQGQGIGKALVEHAVKYAKARRAYKVILDCEDKVIPFYMKCGFTIWQNSMRIDL